jgi:hypothetical protein
MVVLMPRPALKLLVVALLAATACSSQDNIVFGLTAAGSTSGGQVWPIIGLENINSVIGSQVSLFDADGHPTGDQAWVVIISDQDDFCAKLKANRNLFREPPPFGYQALLLFIPANRIGTFVIGRPGDEGTFAELIASAGPPSAPALPPPVFTTPPTQVILENISLTNWDDGAATGTFDLGFVNPINTQTYEFSGRFTGDSCDGLDGTILP